MYKVDVLKVEFPRDRAHRRQCLHARTGARMLSRGGRAWRAVPTSISARASRIDEFVASLELAAEAGARYSGVLCGRAAWQDGVPVYAREGRAALDRWLATEGVRNVARIAGSPEGGDALAATAKRMTTRAADAADPAGGVDLPELHRPQQSLAGRADHAERVRALRHGAGQALRAPSSGPMRCCNCSASRDGWRIDFRCGLVLAGGLFVWSAATVLTGALSGFAALFAARLLVGAGESVAYPCYSRIFATDIPVGASRHGQRADRRGFEAGPGTGHADRRTAAR